MVDGFRNFGIQQVWGDHNHWKLPTLSFVSPRGLLNRASKRAGLRLEVRHAPADMTSTRGSRIYSFRVEVGSMLLMLKLS